MKKKIAFLLFLIGLLFIGGGFLLNHQEEKEIPKKEEKPKEKEEVNLGIYGKLNTRFRIIDNTGTADVVEYYIQNHTDEVQQINKIVITLCDKNMNAIEAIEKEVNQPCNPNQELTFEFSLQSELSQIEDYKVMASLNDGEE